MKKAAVITLHCSDNPGSSLQTFALCRHLSQCGMQVQAIDYRPWYISNNGHPIKRAVKTLLSLKSRSLQRRRIFGFMKKYIPTTEKYLSAAALRRHPPQADIYITGSDQLWNTAHRCGSDGAYYLDFAADAPRLAYAISLGTAPPTEQTLAQIKRHCGSFSAISVREGSSCAPVEGVFGREIPLVCDPTMLISAEEFRGMSIAPEKEKYAVVYLCRPCALLDCAAEYIREKYGCKIIQLGGMKPLTHCDEYDNSIGPEEWLGYIENAEMIITGSFHATVFSLLFHKNFINILPSGNTGRIEQLAGYFGFEERIIRSENQLDITDAPFDFTRTDGKISELAAQSKEFLRRFIEENTAEERV